MLVRLSFVMRAGGGADIRLFPISYKLCRFCFPTIEMSPMLRRLSGDGGGTRLQRTGAPIHLDVTTIRWPSSGPVRRSSHGTNCLVGREGRGNFWTVCSIDRRLLVSWSKAYTFLHIPRGPAWDVIVATSP